MCSGRTSPLLKSLEGYLKDKLMQETDDPELYAKIFREKLVHQFGYRPEVDIVVAGETKLMFGGFNSPMMQMNTLLTTKHSMLSFRSTLHLLESAREDVRKAKAEG